MMSLNSRHRRTASTALTYGTATVAVIIVMLPVLWMLTTSLRGPSELFTVPARWIPDRFTLDSYARLLVGSPLPRFLLNTLIVVASATLVSLVFSCLAAYGMSRFEFRGKGSFLTFLLLTQLFPSIMLLIPYYQVIRSLGMFDTYMALIVTYTSFTIPFCSWTMWGYFKSIPRELDEAAVIDGAGPFRVFRSVILPLALPGAAATAIFSFITGWNEYIFALVLTQSKDMKTVSVGLGELFNQDLVPWNDVMATSVVAVIPLALIFVFLQRYLVGGLTSGAVKG